MKKRGFTLIELLAVIVVLAIIALIAIPIVLNTIEKARKGAALDSVYVYIEEAEKVIALSQVNADKGIEIPESNQLTMGNDSDDQQLEKIKIKGTSPAYVTITFENKKIKTAGFCINGYNIDYKNQKADVSATDYCKFATVKSLVASVSSPVLSTGEKLQIDYTIEPSDVKPSFSSSNESIITVDNNGLITAKSGGEAIVTVSAGLKKVKLSINVSNDSLLGYLEQNTLENDTISDIAVNKQIYSAHIYNYTGDQVWSENMTFGNDADVGTETTSAQNMVIVKVDGNLTINENVIVTAYNTAYGGPKGMLLYVTGTLTNNGKISMTARGAKAAGQDVYLWQNADRNYEYVPASGASGAASDTNTVGVAGSSATGRMTGGGGKGSSAFTTFDGYAYGGGSSGTSYSGGSGGGGNYGNAMSVSGTKAKSNGGAGGSGAQSGTQGSSGAGNPAGNSTLKNGLGENGTGGLLIIYAESINNNGTIESKGSAGGKVASTYYGAGGGSGGGSINIFYKNSYTSNGIIDFTGGAGGAKVASSSVGPGGAGGNGSATIGSIATGTFVQN